MGLVVGLARFARAVPLHRHGQDHGRALGLFHRLRVGGVDLVGIVAAPVEVHDVLVGEVLHQFQRLGVFAEEVFAGIGATVVLVVLQLTVTDFVHALL